MKKTRQWHLWIGLISSIIILMEAITGLLLSEPWLIGGQSRGGEHGMMAPAGIVTSVDAADAMEEQMMDPRQFRHEHGDFRGEGFGPEGNNSAMGIIRQLHEGRFGSAELRIIVDLSAIAMIILTITGIVLSVRVLRNQAKSNRRRAMIDGPGEVVEGEMESDIETPASQDHKNHTDPK